MNTIKELIECLSWHRSEEEQKNAIEKLNFISDSDVVYLAKQSNDLCTKECWENAALVLKNIGYPRNKQAIPYLMEWFQDLNWPGVATVKDLLREIDINILIPYIAEASRKAISNKDEQWCFGLRELMENLIAQNENKEIINLYSELKQENE